MILPHFKHFSKTLQSAKKPYATRRKRHLFETVGLVMLSVGRRSIWIARISTRSIRPLTESGKTIKWIPNAIAFGIHFIVAIFATTYVLRPRSRRLLTLALYYRNVIYWIISSSLWAF